MDESAVDLLPGEVADEQETADDLAGLLLEEILGAGMNGEEAEASNARPRLPPDGRAQSRVGNSFYLGGTLMGTISYLMHWAPPSFSAKCRVHDNCVCTAHMDRVPEPLLEKWLMEASQYPTAEAHLMSKPEGSYNR